MEPIQRIKRLERRVSVLTACLIFTAAAFAIVGLRAQPAVTESLRVRQITVVDAKGTERLWIGAPVPDPIFQGKRVSRSGPVSGVVLLDANGNERSGYVTSDLSGDVFLSLDSEKAQEALFLVNAGGGGHISIYDANRNQARIAMLNGKPTLVLQEKGQVAFEQPPTKK